MTADTARDQLGRVAALSGRVLTGVPADPRREAALRVLLTAMARTSGATWAQVARAGGHGDAKRARRDHHRLEASVRRDVTAAMVTADLARTA